MTSVRSRATTMRMGSSFQKALPFFFFLGGTVAGLLP